MILSSEKKIIIFEEFLDIKKHFSWIKKIAKHNVYYYISPNIANHDTKLLDQIVALGIKVSMDHNYQADNNNYIIVDSNKINPTILKKIKNESIISFWDNLTDDCYFFENRKNIILSQCTWQIEKFLKKYNIPLHQCKKSSLYNYQSLEVSDDLTFVIAGNLFPYYINEMPCIENFDKNLSTVLVYNDGFLREKQVKIGLEKLSHYYNLLVLSEHFFQVRANNIKFVDYSYLGWAVKHSDVNLIPVNSNYLPLALMKGFPVIPVFTRYFDTLNYGGKYLSQLPKEKKLSRFIPFTDILSQRSVFARLCEYFAPIDMENTATLKYYITNSSYWKKYDENIQEIMHKELGVFYADNSDHVIKTIIINLLMFDVPVLGKKVL